MSVLGMVMWLAVAIVAVPMVVLCIECVAALLPRRRKDAMFVCTEPNENVAVDILIPALTRNWCSRRHL